MSLHGKVAIVTGSTSGIGLGIAHALAAEGAAIMLNGFGAPESIEAISRDIASRHGVSVRYHGADMRMPGEIADLVAATVGELGGVQILVNNVGIQFTANIDAFPAERWDAILAINLSSAFHAMHAAIPLMKAAGWGRIVNIASAHGLVASAQKSAYVAAKHGIIGLTKVAGIELANDRVTCNAICPGWVLTDLVQRQIEARALADSKPVAVVEREMLSEKQPMVQFSTPQQIGAMCVFLCSEAAQTITGTALSIDGGWTAC